MATVTVQKVENGMLTVTVPKMAAETAREAAT
jgi:HSP20 family molecular chaperone IbpA